MKLPRPINLSSICLLINFSDCNSLACIITLLISLDVLDILLFFKSNLTPKKVILVEGVIIDFSKLIRKPKDLNNSKDILMLSFN